MTSFYDRLQQTVSNTGALCVGIDPHPSLLEAWGLPNDAEGVLRFGMTVIEALGDRVAALKPQVALFECHGAKGMAALEEILRAIDSVQALSIADAKRGDIGSTMQAYAKTWLSDESPLRADSVTLNPYLGFHSLDPAYQLAGETERGVFVLARTSNPEGGSLQQARVDDGDSVAQMIVDQSVQENMEIGSPVVGLVIGATHRNLGVNLKNINGPVLAPGVGEQGGTIGDLQRQFDKSGALVIASASRSILKGGPDISTLRGRVSDLLSA